MRLKIPGVSFEDDTRGVSGVVGFIFIFAIIMILFSINQAQVVPQENREVEFQHFQEVRDDMVEVRSGISTAGYADVSQFPTVTLGTDYPPRLFAINPPPASGSLETSQAYDIWINDSKPSSQNVSIATRFLEYRNGYNAMDIGSIWYENSVLYLDERDNGGSIAIFEDQNIITGNNSARVIALQNEFQASSSGEISVALYPTENPSDKLSSLGGNVTLKIPTRLNGSEYWDDSIGDLNSNGQWEYHGTEPHPAGIHWLNITVRAYLIDFNTVGIDSAPEGQDSAKQGIGEDPEPSPTKAGPIVYTDSSRNLYSIRNGSSPTSYTPKASVIGPKSANLDGDAATEIPVVSGGDLRFVDSVGVSSPPSGTDNPTSSKSLMAVGVWDDSSLSVFYAGKNNQIHRATESTSQRVNQLSGQAKADAVLGIGDIDGDNSKELVYGGKGSGGNSNTVNYIDSPGGNIRHVSNSQYGTNNAPGVGSLADFDGDGKPLVTIVDGSNNIKLLDSDGLVKTIKVSSATKAPITTSDVDGDGDLEIVYLRSSKLKYIDEVLSNNPTSHFIRNEAGDKVQASSKRGVA